MIIDQSPDVVFLELPIGFNIEFFDEHPECSGQEMGAVKKASAVVDFVVMPVEIPYRNEIKKILAIDSSSLMLDREIENEACRNRKIKRINRQIENIARTLDELTKNCGVAVYLEKKYRSLTARLCKLNDLLEKHLHSSVRYSLLFSSVFNFNIREQVICINCLKKMETVDTGILLIGAGHISIVKKLKKMNTQKGLNIQWIRPPTSAR